MKVWSIAYSLCSFMFFAFIMAEMSVGMNSIYLHRYRTHGAVTLCKWVAITMQAYLMIVLGNGPARIWIALHRKHHTNADGELDPHSPHNHNKWFVMFGLLILHFRAAKKYEAEIIELTPDYEPTWLEQKQSRALIPGLRVPINSYGILGLLLFGGLAWLLGYGFWMGVLFWFTHAVISMVLVGMINSMGHGGEKHHASESHATNLHWFWALLLVGEGGYHGVHHEKPWLAVLGVLDPAGWAILILISLGWASLPQSKPHFA